MKQGYKIRRWRIHLISVCGFRAFDEAEMLPRAVAVMRQFLYSEVREGITYLSVHPVAWSEPTVLERRFDPGISPEEAAEIAGEFAHDDFAFVFEAFWDLWVPNDESKGDAWVQRPVAVRFVVHGVQFDEGIYTDDGHIEVDFGLDTPFLVRRTGVVEGRTKSMCGSMWRSWWLSRSQCRTIADCRGACCGRSRRIIWRKN